MFHSFCCALAPSFRPDPDHHYHHHGFNIDPVIARFWFSRSKWASTSVSAILYWSIHFPARPPCKGPLESGPLILLPIVLLVWMMRTYQDVYTRAVTWFIRRSCGLGDSIRLISSYVRCNVVNTIQKMTANCAYSYRALIDEHTGMLLITVPKNEKKHQKHHLRGSVVSVVFLMRMLVFVPYFNGYQYVRIIRYSHSKSV